MEYEQIPEPGDLSCKGCYFNREITKKTYKKQKNGSYTLQSDEHTDKYGCYAPFKEPFITCKKDHIIFKEKNEQKAI